MGNGSGKKWLGRFLFRVARIKAMGVFVGFVFAYLPFLVPVRKIRQNEFAVSMKHPSACYPNHVLIIFRKIERGMWLLRRA